MQALALNQHTERNCIKTNDRLEYAQESLKYMQIPLQHRHMQIWAEHCEIGPLARATVAHGRVPETACNMRPVSNDFAPKKNG